MIGLADAGLDAANAIKQAHEFGIRQGGQTLAALLIAITDIHSLGLDVAQGLAFTASFYWDLNDGTRAFAERFDSAMPGRKPTSYQAGVYASTLHYLKAVAALHSAKDGAAVVAKMKEMPTDDPLFGKGMIRPDGRKIHPMYLFEAKAPVRIEGRVGPLQGAGDDPGRAGVPPDERGRLPHAGRHDGEVGAPIPPSHLILRCRRAAEASKETSRNRGRLEGSFEARCARTSG